MSVPDPIDHRPGFTVNRLGVVKSFNLNSAGLVDSYGDPVHNLETEALPELKAVRGSFHMEIVMDILWKRKSGRMYIGKIHFES